MHIKQALKLSPDCYHYSLQQSYVYCVLPIPHYWKLVLCRGSEALPRLKSRALGKDLLCRGPPAEALGKQKPSAKTPLPRARPSAKKGLRQRNSLPRVTALGKDALGNFIVLSNGSRAPSAFGEGLPSGPRQRFLIFFL